MVRLSTLVAVAAGTFIAGSTGLYLAQKNVQRRVRALPHYSETFKIIAAHQDALKHLGNPIQVGNVDLTDRHRNYVGDRDSKLHIPVSGAINSGFVNVTALRKDAQSDFKTRVIELELTDVALNNGLKAFKYTIAGGTDLWAHNVHPASTTPRGLQMGMQAFAV